ncbi:MAG: hypothetical protein ABH950_08285 [Candidatus Altiarchaeota archaeon]
MSVVNFKLKKFSGEKTKEEYTSIDVKANSGIRSVLKNHQDRIGDYLEVKFSYDVEYTPGIGNMSLEGTLWYLSKNLDKEVKEEENTIELPANIIQEISTAIIQNCLLESIEFSRKLQLPPPMNMPKVKVEPKQRKFKKEKEGKPKKGKK